ncbi:hypothetical protein AD942_10360 [Gluconobacter japonicus]|uniref:three component ABC system middle component n=1 Tax=Gluconobacter japonicus TaxID=376620 RepID=UPI000781DB30|nr:three component ABC system middle component [Gluconobacter japonicus]KXV39702.1 hypothetical protein AD942_10360 [Gluconobacter japonicus]
MRPPYPDWQQRSSDYRNLFNPAFLMLLVYCVCEAYETECIKRGKLDTVGIPYALIFLALPMALSKSFNDERPKRSAGSLVNWLRTHPVINIDLSTSAYSFVPAVREGVVFALQAGYIEVDEKGLFRVKDEAVNLELAKKIELSRHIENANFSGRWLAKSGSAATILEAFGLRP